MKQATKDQISFVSRAKDYLQEAINCGQANPPQWRLGVVALGSALESLLRAQYGRGPRKLSALIKKFDDDPYWDQFQLHVGALHKCATCSIDAIRNLRNSVHPCKWVECTKRDFYNAMESVLLMQHILVHCKRSRIANFPSGIAFDDVYREAREEEVRQIMGSGTGEKRI